MTRRGKSVLILIITSLVKKAAVKSDQFYYDLFLFAKWVNQ